MNGYNPMCGQESLCIGIRLPWLLFFSLYIWLAVHFSLFNNFFLLHEYTSGHVDCVCVCMAMLLTVIQLPRGRFRLHHFHPFRVRVLQDALVSHACKKKCIHNFDDCEKPVASILFCAFYCTLIYEIVIYSIWESRFASEFPFCGGLNFVQRLWLWH